MFTNRIGLLAVLSTNVYVLLEYFTFLHLIPLHLFYVKIKDPPIVHFILSDILCCSAESSLGLCEIVNNFTLFLMLY